MRGVTTIKATAAWCAACVLGVAVAGAPVAAQGTMEVKPAPAASDKATPPQKDPASAKDPTQAKDDALVYIFSGALAGGETYSGTLLAAADGPEFELKLGKGATCDNNKIEPDKGLLRLPDTPCSDGRIMKALFVYQQEGFLLVYGAVGGDRFTARAHTLSGDPEAAKPR